MKNLLRLSYTLGIIALTLFALTFIASPAAQAACGNPANGYQAGLDCGNGAISVPTAINRTIDVLLYITGAASVIVMVVGGLRYVLSGGDPKNTAAAKDTIMYAAIGLVVSLLAYAIVNFVLTQFQ